MCTSKCEGFFYKRKLYILSKYASLHWLANLFISCIFKFKIMFIFLSLRVEQIGFSDCFVEPLAVIISISVDNNSNTSIERLKFFILSGIDRLCLQISIPKFFEIISCIFDFLSNNLGMSHAIPILDNIFFSFILLYFFTFSKILIKHFFDIK